MLYCAWLANPFPLLLLKYFLWCGTYCLFMHPRPFRKFFVFTSVILTNSAPILCSWLILSQENLESSTVLKYKLYYYSGMGRPTDRSWLPLKRYFVILRVPKKKGYITPQGGTWEAPGTVRRQRDWGENIGKSLYCGFLGKEWVKQSKQARQG